MSNFNDIHNDIVTEQKYAGTKSYRSFDINGKLIEAWVKDDNGEWKDVTARERARLELLEVQEELEKLNRKEMEAYGELKCDK
jgi:5'(3')-deoxyribonucleotidase